jgi:hypothetical protein
MREISAPVSEHHTPDVVGTAFRRSAIGRLLALGIHDELDEAHDAAMRELGSKPEVRRFISPAAYAAQRQSSATTKPTKPTFFD